MPRWFACGLPDFAHTSSHESASLLDHFGGSSCLPFSMGGFSFAQSSTFTWGHRGTQARVL